MMERRQGSKTLLTVLAIFSISFDKSKGGERMCDKPSLFHKAILISTFMLLKEGIVW